MHIPFEQARFKALLIVPQGIEICKRIRAVQWIVLLIVPQGIEICIYLQSITRFVSSNRTTRN